MNISLQGRGKCLVKHAQFDMLLYTNASVSGVDNNFFSSTDLLAAALGTCIGSSISDVLERNGIPLESINIIVEKVMKFKPTSIDKLAVTITHDQLIDERVKDKILRSARLCLIHKSINTPLTIDLIGR